MNELKINKHERHFFFRFYPDITKSQAISMLAGKQPGTFLAYLNEFEQIMRKKKQT